MRRSKLLWLCMAVALTINFSSGCKSRKAGTQVKIDKNSPVPANPANADSSGTSPSAKLTPAPVPNARPNPVPNPPPPDPEK
ncbi:hypothetical protein [Mucilaginibacter terrae]|uniref:Uncharacterized protein n=1 Tax=Mucilaginibacter terrae TaxID=1955052 RepID=A0ABU3GYU0_9SPHI|nr:hypothetical protein [Mucilaginibacter terrae]MDT3404943.1 hypothetical protein [Mucilaginibacter terrae]